MKKKVVLPHEAEGGVLEQEKKSSFFVPKTILGVILLIAKMCGSWINVLVIKTEWRIY